MLNSKVARVIYQNIEAVCNGNENEEVLAMLEVVARELVEDWPADERDLFLKMCGVL